MSEWTEERIEALRETLKATGCGLGAGIAIDVLDALERARTLLREAAEPGAYTVGRWEELLARIGAELEGNP